MMEDNLNGETDGTPLTGDPKKDIVVYGAGTRWSKDKQPSNEAKKKGWQRKLRNRKLAQMILSRKFVGRVVQKDNKSGVITIVDSKFKQIVRDYFDLDEEEMENLSNEAAMMMRMVSGAIESGDYAAAQAMLERAYGKPKEMTPFEDPEVEEEGGGKPQIIIQVVQSIDLPKIAEDEIEDFSDQQSTPSEGGTD